MESIPETFPREDTPRATPGAGTQASVGRALEAFCHESGVAFCALIDESGAVVASASPRGLAPRNLQEIGALAAGAFAATSMLSQKLGEDGFLGLYQAGTRWHAFLGPVTPETSLLCVFDGETLVGIVRAGLERSRTALAAALDSNSRSTRPFWP